MRWSYYKLDENLKIIECPKNDSDGEITGKIIINLKSYFDENPEERIKLGWTKWYKPEDKDLEYDKQTQRVMFGSRRIDEFTVEDYPIYIDKTETELMNEELDGYVMHIGDWVVW